ncbi:hypothetical protein L6R52_04965 [Myxococcota bacterium]|nr:hypothetical protein [Myxococcota bacterium]
MKKMIVVVVDEAQRDRVEEVLDRHQVGGFTELPEAFGEGPSGKKLASRLHPGSNAVIFCVVDEALVPGLKQALVELRTSATAPVKLHVAILPVEDFV